MCVYLSVCESVYVSVCWGLNQTAWSTIPVYSNLFFFFFLATKAILKGLIHHKYTFDVCIFLFYVCAWIGQADLT